MILIMYDFIKMICLFYLFLINEEIILMLISVILNFNCILNYYYVLLLF